MAHLSRATLRAFLAPSRLAEVRFETKAGTMEAPRPLERESSRAAPPSEGGVDRKWAPRAPGPLRGPR